VLLTFSSQSDTIYVHLLIRITSYAVSFPITAFPEEDSNQNGNSFTAKLQKWLGEKTGKIHGGGNALNCKMPLGRNSRQKILRFESLEEWQLLAADSGLMEWVI